MSKDIEKHLLDMIKDAMETKEAKYMRYPDDSDGKLKTKLEYKDNAIGYMDAMTDFYSVIEKLKEGNDENNSQ